MKTALLLLSLIGLCVSEYCGWHGDTSKCTTLCSNGFHLTCVNYQCTCAHSAPDTTCSSVDKCNSLGKCPVNMHWECLSDGHCHCRTNTFRL
uniref:Uncharacterized protein n=1 Tax=Magallana gigas TaxID=29159 RepID=A0A8W8NBG4_MAGGI